MKHFLKGFVYAFRGIIFCVKEERNFRFHLGAAFHLFVYLPFFKVTRAETGVLVILCALVLALEAMNSAVERAVNCTGEYSQRAGAAKLYLFLFLYILNPSFYQSYHFLNL